MSMKKPFTPSAPRRSPRLGRPDLVRCNLVKGRNRIVVVSRQAAGPWFFAIGVAPVAASREKPAVAATPKDLH